MSTLVKLSYAESEHQSAKGSLTHSDRRFHITRVNLERAGLDLGHSVGQADLLCAMMV